MSVFQTTEEAREFFKKDLYAYRSGMMLDELGEDYAVCSADVREDFHNANGGVQGGAIFTLADLAFAALSNNLHLPTVAQQVNIVFLSAPKGTRLIARAEVIKNGRSTSVINVSVSDDSGRGVAQFTGVGFKL
ncbi:MAG: PaaI family thioesterase [Oscillospiraceae bacterium]|jgi:acyl-CoA thioesterase|nr:PaaI family thioesterase [Oscillospiraceae bacterium]